MRAASFTVIVARGWNLSRLNSLASRDVIKGDNPMSVVRTPLGWGAALPRLSPQHSEVIDLVYYHGKSVKEVAEIVGDDEATVKTRMFNARRQLAELAELCTYALALKSRLAPTAYNGNHRTSPGVRG
jgi:DNA-binding NarL/FixJ family response regulator